MTLAFCFLLMALLAEPTLAEDNWAQFRGPGALGVAEGANLPETWSATENVVWKTEIAGRGWSSPVVWEETIFLTSVVSDRGAGAPRTGLYSGGPQSIPAGEHQWVVLAIDWTTGAISWEREVHRGRPERARHLKNSYASETPVVDAERVYFYFGNLGLFVFDHEGNPAWEKRFEPVETENGWGTGASPVLHGDRLFIVNDNETASFVVAFDASTGEELWRRARDEKTNWSTPYVWENEIRTELVTAGANKIRSYDLKVVLVWELAGMSSITIPTPFSQSGLLYVASGYVGDDLRPVYSIRPGASGDITPAAGETSNEYVAWSHRQAGPYNPSPLVYKNAYYTLYDRGFFTSHDAETGEEIYGKRRIDPVAGAFTASPWAYDGKIFCLSEEGTTYVIRPGDTFEVVGTNALDEVTLATPAIARDSLLIRTASHLYRIAKEKEPR